MNRGRGRGAFWSNSRNNNPGTDRVTRYGVKPQDFNEPAFVTQASHIPILESQKRSPQTMTTTTTTAEPAAVRPTTPVQQTQVVKEELMTPPPRASNTEDSAENNNSGTSMTVVEGDDEGSKNKKPWSSRRTTDAKLPKKIRKRRQNARLKNILVPKNAMMLLHELHPDMKMTILEQSNVNHAYTVEIEIEGEIYRGHGMSKAAAKQAGSENALKAVLLKKVEESKNRAPEDVEMTELKTENGTNKKAPAEDDVPWGSLASFAIFKLFTEWQAQGYQLPNMGQNSSIPPAKGNGSFVQAPQKKIPDDAHTKHPVQLLNQLRPGLQYVEDRDGMPPHTVFTFRVTIDDRTFMGTGSNKKDAKKHCAKQALEAMGVVYPPDYH